MKRFRAIAAAFVPVLALAIAVASGAGALARAPARHSEVRLVAATKAIVPGERLWVGLHFRMDPGWHIYWVNPGDSGQPPTVKWDLPAGFRAGPLAWPAPKRLGKGTVVDYGYENEVLLLAALQSPAALAPGTRVRLAAGVQWLVCREICIPAKESVRLDLPVARRTVADPVTQSLFRRARAQLPRPVPRNWRVTAVDQGSRFVLSVLTGRREGSARFFPRVPDQVDNAKKQAVSPLANGVRLSLWKSDLLAKPVEILTGVIDLGNGRVYAVSSPVSPAGK
jgi:DsbC/DsbD-like thiol-disulfide interchange protein